MSVYSDKNLNREQIELMVNNKIPLSDMRYWIVIDSKDEIVPDSLGGNGELTYETAHYLIKELDETYLLLGRNHYHKIGDEFVPNGNYDEVSEQDSITWLNVHGGELITDTEFKEKERVFMLGLKEYKEELIDALKKEKDDVNFKITFNSNARDGELEYSLNLKTFSELEKMVSIGLEKGLTHILWHDDSMMTHDMTNPYTIEEGATLLLDASLQVAYRDAKYDIFKTRASLMEAKLKKEQIMVEVFSEEEQAYIDAVVNATLMSFQ